MSAGGGFKQVLVDTGIGTRLADWAQGANISVLLLAWLIAVLIRLATGSATVATITASSLMVAWSTGLRTGETSLVVLAIGAGSLFFSHVNDAGFWLVKEYFGMTVGQTIKSFTALGEGDEPLGQRTQPLGLGLGRRDLVVLEQRRGEVRQHQPLVRGAAAEAGTLGGGRHRCLQSVVVRSVCG